MFLRDFGCRARAERMPLFNDVSTGHPASRRKVGECCPGIVVHPFLVWHSGAAQTVSSIVNRKNIDSEFMERDDIHLLDRESRQWSESGLSPQFNGDVVF